MRFVLALALLCATSAGASPQSDWRPKHTVFCSDGIFDWDSGQSLYDFVILERAEDDFIISYLGIPHPSFEDRQYDHLWLKISGHFSSSLHKRGAEKTYRLNIRIKDEPARIGVLQVDAKGNYQFNVTPPLNRETTKTGLCWDSLR